MKNRATKALEIPELELDYHEKSRDDSFNELPRKISQTSIYSHNHETGSIEMLNVKPKKFHSPNQNNSREVKFSHKPSFARMVKIKERFEDTCHSPILEVPSNSVSPNTSFKKLRSTFATHQEKQIDEKYYTHRGEVIIEKHQRKITRYSDTPVFRKYLSENLFQQDQRSAMPNRFAKQMSFNLKKMEKQLLPQNEKIQLDFTDNNFFNAMTNNKKPAKKSENFYQRSKRSKTFKEDDSEYFFEPIKILKKRSRCKNNNKLTTSASHDEEFRSRLMTESVNKKEASPKKEINKMALVPAIKKINFDSKKQIIARVFKSSKSDFINKEKEESIIVQNQHDIHRENEIKDFIHHLHGSNSPENK
jgi:hypothetical protein